MIIHRRSLITGLGLSLMAPAIVRADSLMKLPVFKCLETHPYVWSRKNEGFQMVGLGDGVVYKVFTYDKQPMIFDYQIKENLVNWQNFDEIVELKEIRTGQPWKDLADFGIPVGEKAHV
jgi:hypothetical protein